MDAEVTYQSKEGGTVAVVMPVGPLQLVTKRKLTHQLQQLTVLKHSIKMML